jgi:hypothetical protein
VKSEIRAALMHRIAVGDAARAGRLRAYIKPKLITSLAILEVGEKFGTVVNGLVGERVSRAGRR